MSIGGRGDLVLLGSLGNNQGETVSLLTLLPAAVSLLLLLLPSVP